MDANAINDIQSKLRHQAEMLSQAQVEVPVDWPRPYGVKAYGKRTPSQGEALAAAVTMLKQRSLPRTVPPEDAQPSAPAATAELNPGLYQRRLRAMVDHINALSSTQEQAIAELQRVQAQLAHLEPAWMAERGEPLAYPRLRFDQLATARAHLDRDGNIVLAHQPLGPAAQVAQGQALYRPQPHRPRAEAPVWVTELSLLWQEPLAGMRRLLQGGQWLGAGVQDWLLAAPWSLSLIASLLWGLTGLGLGRLLLMVLMRLSWAWMPGVLAMLVAAIVHTLYQSMFTRRRPQTSFNRLALLGGILLGLGL